MFVVLINSRESSFAFNKLSFPLDGFNFKLYAVIINLLSILVGLFGRYECILYITHIIIKDIFA